jgi:ATP-dependent helicase/nuclease subunit B
MKALIGPPNSGKSERVIARVAEAIIESRGQVYAIVPSEPAALVMNEKLQSSMAGCPVKSRQQPITTFPKFYAIILEKLGCAPIWLNLIERRRLLRRVISELAETGKLGYFAEIAALPGLAAAVAGFIDELWQTGASPDAVNLFAQSRGKKERDIALINESYAAALDSLGATESEAAGRAALCALESSPPSANLNLSLIAVDGFDFYSAVQTRLLSILSSRGVETIATLDYEEGRAAHLWQKPTMARLNAACAEIVACESGNSTPFDLAASRFMADEDADSLSDSLATRPVEIISAPDRAAETRAIAREIKRLAIERDCALDDITVVCRSLALYSAHIERVFKECSIPVTIDSPLQVAENPAILSLVRLLGLSSKNFTRLATIECLRSPYFDLSSFGLDEESAESLDQISIVENVTRGRHQWDSAIRDFTKNPDRKRLDLNSSEDASVDAAEIEARFASLRTNLNKFFDDITPPDEASRGEFANWVIGAMEKFRIAEQAKRAETESRDEKALEEFRSIVNAIGSDRLSSLYGRSLSGEIRWPSFLEEMNSAISVLTYDRMSSTGRAVLIQGAHNMRPRRYRAVFIAGLIEGEFPASAAERAPLSNQERQDLRDAGIDLTETPADAGADLAQFCKAISRASERLFLSYSRTDVAGGELLPSYLIEEIGVVLPVKETRIPQGFAMGKDIVDFNPTSFEELALQTAHAIGLAAGGFLSAESIEKKLLNSGRLLESNLPSWKNTLRASAIELHRLKSSERGCFDGIILDSELREKLRDKFGPEWLWSASQINDFGSCPFRFFAKNALKLSPIVEPGEGFKANKLGNVYHKILEKIYTRLQSNGARVSSENASAIIDAANEITEQALEEMLESGTIRKGPLWTVEKEEIRRSVARLIEKEAEWNNEQPASPAFLERKFGIGNVRPLTIESEDGDVRLCGQIDRIDKFGDEMVVIDYKTGRTPIRHKDALEGRNLQLPIYAMAASRVIDARSTVASAYYLHIGSCKKGSELPYKDDPALSIKALIEHAESLILDYAARARKGIFPIQPNENRCHPGCEFDSMCRIQSLGPAASDE